MIIINLPAVKEKCKMINWTIKRFNTKKVKRNEYEYQISNINQNFSTFTKKIHFEKYNIKLIPYSLS